MLGSPLTQDNNTNHDLYLTAIQQGVIAENEGFISDFIVDCLSSCWPDDIPVSDGANATSITIDIDERVTPVTLSRRESSARTNMTNYVSFANGKMVSKEVYTLTTYVSTNKLMGINVDGNWIIANKAEMTEINPNGARTTPVSICYLQYHDPKGVRQSPTGMSILNRIPQSIITSYLAKMAQSAYQRSHLPHPRDYVVFHSANRRDTALTLPRDIIDRYCCGQFRDGDEHTLPIPDIPDEVAGAIVSFTGRINTSATPESRRDANQSFIAQLSRFTQMDHRTCGFILSQLGLLKSRAQL